MEERQGLFPTFLALFEDLRRKTSHDPKKVGLFTEQSQGLQETVRRLGRITEQIQSTLAKEKRKYLTNVPDAFPVAWADYETRWSTPVMRAYWNLWWHDLGIDFGEISDGQAQHPAGAVEVHLEPPDYYVDEEFLVNKHDPSVALEYVFQRIADELPDYYEESDDPNEYWTGNMLHGGLQAWDYVTGIIGFDPANVARRWRMVPPVFVPKHVADRRGLTEHDLLYVRLDNAVRAFVFGAPLAAVAMCRALCEMVLKEHYELGDDELDSVIVLAEQRYPWIRRLKLDHHRRQANRVLHARAIDVEEERAVLEFLAVVKALIERAPNSGLNGDRG